MADLSRRASVDAQVLDEIVAGRQTKVSTAALARVARELGVEPTELWSNSQPDDARLSVRFRNAGIPDFFAADEPTLRNAINKAMQVRALNESLGLTPPLGDSWFPAEAVGAIPYEDGYRKARQVRNGLHVKGFLTDADEPLGDISTIVEEAFGIPVLEDNFRAGSVLALTVKIAELGAAAVVVNGDGAYGLTEQRRRVDVSHELAHALFDSPSKSLGLWIDETTDVESEGAADRVEQRARAFAAELLLPIQGLRHLLGTPPSRHPTVQAAVDLALRARAHFGTTSEITINHLANHGYMPKHMRDAVKEQMPPAPTARPVARRRLLERRVREAVARGLMTQMRARELLSLSAWDTLAES